MKKKKLDHSKHLKQYLDLGINVYSNKSVINKFGGEKYNFKAVEPLKTFQVGSFKVMFFPAQHDVETYGMLIEHVECGKILFATDTYYIKYKFKGLNNLILETNYSKEIINRKVAEQGISSFLKDRVLRSHFSLENAIQFLNENDLSQVNTINLIHLSSSNSNAVEFQQKVAEATGKLVTVLEKGLSIDFNKNPF